MYVKNYKKSLCVKCGTCSAISGNKISFDITNDKSYPNWAEIKDEQLLERISKSCPQNHVDYISLSNFCFGDKNKPDYFFGQYKNLYISHSNDKDVRYNASSGGILSEILIYLLEKGLIDGAIVSKMDPKEPWKPHPFIATSKEGIMEAAGSKYILTCTNKILSKIDKEKYKNLAYVGTPCQVHSIRKMQSDKDPIVEPIKYVFGPFCGNILNFSSIIGFLRTHGFKDFKKIKKLQFRAGEWPGKLRIEVEDSVIETPKFYANYLIPFHIFKRCLLCPDLTNELADISGGDAWAPKYEERGKGFSLLISRSTAGEKLIEDMKKDGRLTTIDLDYDEALSMHSHAYDLKKTGSNIRINIFKKFKAPTPNIIPLKGLGEFKFRRILAELFNISLFSILGTALARRLSEFLPPKQTGEFFIHIRKQWKKRTKKG